MNILESLEWRYATKKFDSNEILSSEIIKRLSVAFNLTATSYGLQPVKLKIVQNKALQAKMRDASMRQEQVATASHVLVFCIENKVDKTFIDNYFETIKSTRDGNDKSLEGYHKVLIERFSVLTEEQIKEWATKQAYIALGNLLTVCAVEKVDSCPMEGFIPNEIDALLNLDKENLSSVLLLPIGIRASDDKNAIHKKVRRPLGDIVALIS